MDDGTHTATLRPQAWQFSVPPGVDLVSAAQAAGIRLPRSCRNGTCRTCLCRLVEGEVRYRVEWPGLSAEERTERWILPCVAVPCTDVILDAPAGTLEAAGR